MRFCRHPDRLVPSEVGLPNAAGTARRWLARDAICLATILSTLLAATDTTILRAAPPEASGAAQIDRFSLTDIQGAKHTPAEWRGKKAVLLLFIGTECPVSNFYSPDMQQLAARYSGRGVACYGVHADPSVTAEQAAAHAKDYGLPFAILLDPEQALARMAGARVTPEAVVASPDGKVLYRGRIDDRYSLDGKRRDEPTTHELVDALEAVLAGKKPAISRTQAFGCPLPKLKPR
jgi:peroxiredoxin